MENSDFSNVTVAGFNLTGLLLSFSAIAVFAFIVYWLWGCSWRDEEDEECKPRGHNRINCTPTRSTHAVVPLYAFELEPGTVVLQSEDGEIFRILREYDSVGRTGSGSPPLYSSIATNRASDEFHYMPSYTRAHFQTRASAPEWESSSTREPDPPSRVSGDGFIDGGPWTPINTRNESY